MSGSINQQRSTHWNGRRGQGSASRLADDLRRVFGIAKLGESEPGCTFRHTPLPFGSCKTGGRRCMRRCRRSRSRWQPIIYCPRLTAIGFRRHCLRSAESGMLLPRLYLFRSGNEICVPWYSDESNRYLQMPASFLENGLEYVPAVNAEASLAEFVETVLERLSGSDDARYRSLVSDWKAVQQADVEEQDFCGFACQMGLDPYDLSNWHPGLAELFESQIGPKRKSPVVDGFGGCFSLSRAFLRSHGGHGWLDTPGHSSSRFSFLWSFVVRPGLARHVVSS